MSKKRKCRYTPEEAALHKEAARLRRMTDKQLVEEFHRAAEPEVAASVPSVAQDVPKGDTPIGNTGALEKLLNELSDGKCFGIKGATVYKICTYAKERGYLE